MIDKFFDEEGKFLPELFVARTSDGAFEVPCTLRELMAVLSKTGKTGVTLRWVKPFTAEDVAAHKDFSETLTQSYLNDNLDPPFVVWDYRQYSWELFEKVRARFKPAFIMEIYGKRFAKAMCALEDAEHEMRVLFQELKSFPGDF
tara:strand:- start:518 stop:952 length:435 start_codon:yes stop_codon:yes gene_type:complete